MRGGHPRRLPADRGTPAAGRVLGRHGRGDPLLQGRRPAHARGQAPHGLWAPPCRELLLTPEVRARAKELAGKHPGRPRCSASSPTGSRSRAWSRSPRCSPTAWSCCSTTCRSARIVLACDPERVRTRAMDLVAHQPGVPRGVLGRSRGRRRGAGRPRRLARSSRSRRRPRGSGRLGVPWWTVAPFGSPTPTRKSRPRREPATSFGIRRRPAPAYRGDTEPRMLADVRAWLAEGWRVVLVTEGHGPAQRLVEVLRGEGFGRAARRASTQRRTRRRLT